MSNPVFWFNLISGKYLWAGARGGVGGLPPLICCFAMCTTSMLARSRIRHTHLPPSKAVSRPTSKSLARARAPTHTGTSVNPAGSTNARQYCTRGDSGVQLNGMLGTSASARLMALGRFTGGPQHCNLYFHQPVLRPLFGNPGRLH